MYSSANGSKNDLSVNYSTIIPKNYVLHRVFEVYLTLRFEITSNILDLKFFLRGIINELEDDTVRQ